MWFTLFNNIMHKKKAIEHIKLNVINLATIIGSLVIVIVNSDMAKLLRT